MPIITIYRGAFTAGEEIAKGVAQALGYQCVSREVLIEASRSCGISEVKLNEVLEKDPHWWERWLQNMRPYRVALQAAMCEEETSFTTGTSAMSFCLGSAMY
jgi:hypothetical protein